MKYPKLVLPKFCKTKVYVKIETNDTDEYGNPSIVYEGELLSNFQGVSRRIYNEHHEYVEISGTAMFCDDFCNEVMTISGGSIKFYNEKTKSYENEKKIYKGQKALNPDGTVNYVKIEVM